MNIFGVGSVEIIIILLVALVVLGPNQLLSMARGLGDLIRRIRVATTQFTQMIDDEQHNEPPSDSHKEGQ